MKRRIMRRRGLNLLGYTLVEALIFLAVSGGLLVSTMTLVGGKESKTRFTQSVATLEQDLQDVMNDISTGYFPSRSDFKCQPDGAGSVTFSGTTVEQGQNAGCIFVGKAIELGPVGDKKQYNSYTMVGRQGATSLSNAGVKLLLGIPTNPGIVENDSMGGGVEITKVVNLDTGATLAGMAIVSDFGQVSAVDNSVSGNAARVTLFGYSGNFTSTGAITAANFVSTTNGILVCMQEAGIVAGRKATLTIGASGQLSIERKIDDATGC